MPALDLYGCYLIADDGRRIPLTQTEAKVADYLARNQGRIVSPREMMAKLWGDPDPIDTTVVRMHIASIREKAGGDVIVTRHRMGYMWGAHENQE